MIFTHIKNPSILASVSFRIVGVIVLLGSSLLLNSCCPCTLKACFDESVFVELTDASGTDFKGCESLIMRWSTETNSGEVTTSDLWDKKTTFDLPGEEDTLNGDFIETDTERLHIELLCDDVVLLLDEYPIEWTTFVCNKCGGPGWCDDDMATTGSISIEVDSTAFPTN